jgi:hypothetical protein
MIDEKELERIWKGGIMAQFRHHLVICLKGLRKTMKSSKRVAGVLVDFRTEDLLNKSIGCLHHTNLLHLLQILKNISISFMPTL